MPQTVKTKSTELKLEYLKVREKGLKTKMQFSNTGEVDYAKRTMSYHPKLHNYNSL